MNKDAESRWKVGMSNIKLKMRAKTARSQAGKRRHGCPGAEEASPPKEDEPRRAQSGLRADEEILGRPQESAEQTLVTVRLPPSLPVLPPRQPGESWRAVWLRTASRGMRALAAEDVELPAALREKILQSPQALVGEYSFDDFNSVVELIGIS